MKIFKRRTFVFALGLVVVFLMTGRAVNAQSKAQGSSPPNLGRVEVGNTGVKGSHLEPYTNRWKFTQQKPGEAAEPAGTWSDSLESVIYQGRPALKRTQIAKYDKKAIQLTFV